MMKNVDEKSFFITNFFYNFFKALVIFPVRDFANLYPGINRFFNLVDNADIDPPVCRLLFRYRLRPPPT